MRFLAAIVLLLLVALPAHAQSLSQALVVSSCGSPTLTIGLQVQATMDTTGRLCSHKTGSGVSPPVISVAPVASGSLTVGSTLSCTTGTWTNSPTSYAYTWLRGGTPISGATSATYLTVSADGGTSVGCSVIASNAGGGSAPSASNTLAIAAAGGCSQATAYLARATGETTHASDLTTLICGLVTDGVWTKLDALYVLAQQTQADARLNLVSTSYPLTGSPTFTAYQGFSGFSTNGLVTGFNPSTAPSPQFTQNSASAGFWAYSVSGSNTGADFGEFNATGTNNVLMAANYTGFFVPRINWTSASSVTTPGTNGLFVADRPSSSSRVPYWNGGSLGSASDTSTAVDNTTFTIGFANVFGPTLNPISEAHIGASLGALNTQLYNRLRTYMTAVGVP